MKKNDIVVATIDIVREVLWDGETIHAGTIGIVTWAGTDVVCIDFGEIRRVVGYDKVREVNGIDVAIDAALNFKLDEQR